MLHGFMQFLNSIQGHSIVVNFDGFISSLKHYEKFDFAEDETFIIFNKNQIEDFWIAKDEITNVDFYEDSVVLENNKGMSIKIDIC